MKFEFTLVAALCFSIAGCATKNYPIATEVSALEKSALDCREIAIELSKVDQTEAKISDTAELDWRSGAAFLGDFGIGNAMARNDAEHALAARRQGLIEARAGKGCLS